MRKNSYDAIRFIAASLVIIGHSFALVKLPEPHIGNVTLGRFAVWVFFVMSGFLISQSWKSFPRFNVFIYKRVWRIFPALIVAVVATILALGFISTLGYGSYIIDSRTIAYLNNILLIRPYYFLPGVFESNPYPAAVNGSLWTLFYEFVMYVLVGLFGAHGYLKRRSVKRIWLVLFALNIIVLIPGQSVLKFYLFYLDVSLFLQLALMFTSGVLLQIYDAKIHYSLRSCFYASLFFFAISTLWTTITPLLACTLLAWFVIGLGKSEVFWKLSRHGDFSYGLYIYAFPVQQSLVYFTQTSSAYKLMGASFFITLLLAVASWKFVESKFIKFKIRIDKDSYPLTKKHKELADAW